MAITPHAAGAWAATNAAATATVTLPTHSTGDLLIVVGAQKAATIANSNPSITTPATGWTRFLDGASGANNSGNGTGSVHMSVFWKVAASAAETNPVITWGDNSSPAVVNAWSFTSATGLFYTPVGVIKVGNVATSISITHDSNPGITAADLGLVILTMGDNNALTVPSWTATTAVLDAVVEYPDTAISSATGNDMAADAGYRIVSSGTATAAPVQTHTSAAADENIGAFVRLRELPNTSPAAELASATGTAQAATGSLGVMAGLASATGTAHQPTVQTFPVKDAPAGLGSATGTAQQPAVQIAPAAGVGSATGTAQAPTAHVQPNAGGAGTGLFDPAYFDPAYFDTAITGTAHAPTANTGAKAGLASATGTAQAAKAAIAPAAGLASATGTAQAPAANVAGASGVATGTGTASAPAAGISGKAGVAAALASAYDQTGSVGVMAGLASAIGTAWQPTIQIVEGGPLLDVDAGHASAVGTAHDPTVVTVDMGVTPDTGGIFRSDQLLKHLTYTTGPVDAPAATASAIGTAHQPTVRVDWLTDEYLLGLTDDQL